MNDSGKQTRDVAVRQLIAIRAYEMWENQGRPRGYDLIHWHQAEQDVMACVTAAAERNDLPLASPGIDFRQPLDSSDIKR